VNASLLAALAATAQPRQGVVTGGYKEVHPFKENFAAVNNALLVDLTGQVAAESLDHRMYSGAGGQSVFMIAGAYSRGGRSVSVLPSSSIPRATGQRVSRIVPVLPPGCSVIRAENLRRLRGH
jgi:acyl-CoA hydrolase